MGLCRLTQTHSTWRCDVRPPRKFRGDWCSGPRLDADAAVDGGTNALLAAEVPLGRLNRDVPEQELNLLQLATRRMAEPGTCPPEVVRREPVSARFTGVLPNDAPDGFSVRPSPRRSRFCLPDGTAFRRSDSQPEATHRGKL